MIIDLDETIGELSSLAQAGVGLNHNVVTVHSSNSCLTTR